VSTNQLRWSIAATLAALLAVVAYVLAQAYPSSEAVRLRNSLIIAPADPLVGQWTPDNVPAAFRQETMPIPKSIADAAMGAIPDRSTSDREKARALAAHLMTRVKDKGPIQLADVEATYWEIIDKGRGYCADVIDAYMALALAAGLPVRAWAFSFDGFGGRGHIVVEVFDGYSRQWVMLDVFNNVMPVMGYANDNMSVREFLQNFREREREVRFVPIGPGRVAYSVDEKLRMYYRLGVDQWYLWAGNNVVSRGNANPLITSVGRVSQAGAELAAIATGHYPRIVPLPTSTNAGHVERMFSLRERLLLASSAASVLVLVFAFLLIAYLRRGSARHHQST
jgi:hypothetical protein